MMAYGTNDVTGPHWDPQDYRRRFEATLEAMRQVMPQAMCAIITPGDRVTTNKVRKEVRDRNGRTRKMVQTRYDMQTFPQRHMEAARIQREVGERHQCVSWDFSLIHLTPIGYQEMAKIYAKWLGL